MQEGTTITALNPEKFRKMSVLDIDINIQENIAERIRLNEEKYKERIMAAKSVYEDTLKAIDSDVNYYLNQY